MSDTKLLPCPFCGQTDKLVHDSLGDPGDWFVECERCHLGTHAVFYGARRSAEHWNTRALTPKQAAADTPKKMRERDMGAFNAGYDAAIAHARADTPEQMRERCFHDFLRLIQAYMKHVDQEGACVLQRFSGFVEQHGIPGLGTGTCDCGEDDCPYKTASVPCDCGLSDCSDPRAALAKGGAEMSDTKLLPCPFPHKPRRGGDLEIVGPKPNYHWSAWVKCPCGASSPACNTREEAIAAWNTRPAPALTPKQAAADEMYAALTSVAANLDPDSTDSDQYRNDDPEGAMDTCFSIARAALAKAGQP